MGVMGSKPLVHCKGVIKASGRGTVNLAGCMRCWKINCGNLLLIRITDFEKNRINRVLHLRHDAVKYKRRRNVGDAKQREVELLLS